MSTPYEDGLRRGVYVRNELARITFIRALINGADKNVTSSDAQLTGPNRGSVLRCENAVYWEF